MGSEFSSISDDNIPEDVQEQYEKNLGKRLFTNREGESTLPTDELEMAGEIIAKYFEGKNPNILEVFAKNQVGSNIINKKLPAGTKHKMTDIINGINSVQAVEQFGKEYDILMMISVPPGQHYADYFAIEEWKKLDNAKYVIFVGELGQSDGSIGMHNYMFETWKLEHEEAFSSHKDIFGGDCIKKVFIFSRK